MRLDPKYFNLFLGVCAAITVVVIIISTIYYSSKQQQNFRDEIKNADLSQWNVYHFASDDSLSVKRFEGNPVVIHFWSTWSDMSLDVNEALHDIKQQRPEILIIAAATRDGDQMVKDYISEVEYDFVFVNGTNIYQDLMVPGLPTQLFLNAEGRIEDHLVGRNYAVLNQKIQSLLDKH